MTMKYYKSKDLLARVKGEERTPSRDPVDQH